MLGKPVALADHAQGVLEKMIRALARELDVRARLEQVHLVHDVEQEVRHLVRAVRAVAQQAADVDVGEVGVGAALGRGDARPSAARDGC